MKTDKSPSSRMKRTNGRRQDHLPGPGHPALTPDIRPLEPRPLQQQSRPSLQGPDIRRPARTSGPSPDIRPEARKSGATLQNLQKPTPPARTSGPTARTSGVPGMPGCLARRPDVRLPLPARSNGPKPMYPLALLDYIYSSSTYVLGLAKD